MRLRPVPVAGGLHFLELRAGDGHTCGIATDSRAYCWGSGGYGQLGDGTTTSTQLGPVAVAAGRKFRSISAGRRYTCAVNFYDVAFCWGDVATSSSGSTSVAQSSSVREFHWDAMALL